MKREIIFRGKSLNTNNWVYGDLHQDKIRKKVYIEYEVDPKTIGQYTGLKDANGNKVFEGDLLKTPLGFIGEVVFGKAVDKCKHMMLGRKIVDVYTTYGWCFRRADDYLCAIDDSILSGEIIGNAHENPQFIHDSKKLQK